MASDAGGHRLHPLSLLFRIGATLKSLLVPAVLIIFASGEHRREAWVLAFVVPSVIHAVFHYVTFRYHFEGDEMVVRGGVIFRFERHVPYERIQNIDLSQSLFHRMLGVADVKVETASGGEAEANMQVLSLSAVDAMRRRVFEGRAGAPSANGGEDAPDAESPAPERHTVLRMSPRDLVLFGIISNRGMAVVLAALGLAWELDLLPDETPDSLALDDAAVPGALILVAGAIAAVFLLRVLSVVWSFWHLYGFTLERSGDDLQTQCGLFTRLTATIPRQRIQVVTVRETFLHRCFGRLAVKVDTAGGSMLEEKSATRRWIAPLIREDELPALLAELQPEVDVARVEWRGVDPRAWRRIVKRWWTLVALLTAGAVALWGWWGAAVPVVLLPLTWWDSRKRVQRLGWSLGEQAVFVRSGLWTQVRSIIRYPKMQVVSWVESPFDRHWDTASLSIDAAGVEEVTAIPYLPVHVARGVQAHLAERAATTVFRW